MQPKPHALNAYNVIVIRALCFHVFALAQAVVIDRDNPDFGG